MSNGIMVHQWYSQYDHDSISKICVSSLFSIKNEKAESFVELGRVTEHTCSYSMHWSQWPNCVFTLCVIYEPQKNTVHHE